MMRYYSLKFNGRLIKNRERDLVIGQCADADLRLPSDSIWEDENFFVIRFRKESGSWFAVRISENVDFKINGMTVGLVCPLKNGDVIDVEDSTIRFNVVEDSAYNPDDGILMLSTKLKRQNKIAIALFAVVAISILTLAHIQNKEKAVEHWRWSSRELNSVKKIHVDSVFVQTCSQDGAYRNIAALPYFCAGTCFITRTGMLVTARHCIQPWISLDFVRDTVPSDILLRDLAVSVETANFTGVDTTMRLVAKLKIDGIDRTFWSGDFEIDASRDLIVNFGTRRNPRIWRSIRPSFHKRDNELGDIAWMKDCGVKGGLRLAGEKQMLGLSNNEPLSILGFSDNQGRESDTPQNHFGNLKMQSRGYESCFFHDDQAFHGDSGGPVIIRRGRKFYVISVLSRKDERRGPYSSWSVPVTEIKY